MIPLKWVRPACCGMLLSLLLALSLALLSQNAAASSVWKKWNQTTATWLWLDIYQATLYGPADLQRAQLLSDQTPLKLELCYLRSIGRKDFVKNLSFSADTEISPRWVFRTVPEASTKSPVSSNSKFSNFNSFCK